jgi:hypothetical protein
LIEVTPQFLRLCADAVKRSAPVIVGALSALTEPTRPEAVRLLPDGSLRWICEPMQRQGAVCGVMWATGLVVDEKVVSTGNILAADGIGRFI